MIDIASSFPPLAPRLHVGSGLRSRAALAAAALPQRSGCPQSQEVEVKVKAEKNILILGVHKPAHLLSCS